METVIYVEFLKGLYNEDVVKEVALASDGVLQSFHFQSPCGIHPHGSAENGLNWDNGHIQYNQLYKVLSEAVAHYGHLYSRDAIKCQFLSELLDHLVHDLDALECPEPHELKSKYSCYMTCHKFPHIRCPTRNAHALYDWLTYHFKTNSFVKCSNKERTRYTARFASGIQQH